MPEENSGIRPDFLLHKLSHPLFISITNWWTPVHEQDSLKYRQNDTKKDMLQKMTVFPASYLSLIQWQTARKYRAVCFLDGINQITSTNDLAPAIFTFVRIFLKVWKSRFFQFLQAWDASIQILFCSPDGAVKSGEHSSKFNLFLSFFYRYKFIFLKFFQTPN